MAVDIKLPALFGTTFTACWLQTMRTRACVCEWVFIYYKIEKEELCVAKALSILIPMPCRQLDCSYCIWEWAWAIYECHLLRVFPTMEREYVLVLADKWYLLRECYYFLSLSLSFPLVLSFTPVLSIRANSALLFQNHTKVLASINSLLELKIYIVPDVCCIHSLTRSMGFVFALHKHGTSLCVCVHSSSSLRGIFCECTTFSFFHLCTMCMC